MSSISEGARDEPYTVRSASLTIIDSQRTSPLASSARIRSRAGRQPGRHGGLLLLPGRAVMRDQPFNVTRDRIGQRLAELARLLSNPANVSKVQAELNRLSNG